MHGLCGTLLSSSSTGAGPGPAARQKQLAQARQEFDWLAAGSSPVQQQALRDFDRGVQGFFDGVYRRPTWRRRHLNEGFCIRDTTVSVLNGKWAQVFAPKLGRVKFRMSRPLPAGKLGTARVTFSGGRWHVSFPAAQPAVAARTSRAEKMVGIDRGVATTLALSDGTMLRAPLMRRAEQKRLVKLQRQLARCRKGNTRTHGCARPNEKTRCRLSGRRNPAIFSRRRRSTWPDSSSSAVDQPQKRPFFQLFSSPSTPVQSPDA